jgi:hypothetical protein
VRHEDFGGHSHRCTAHGVDDSEMHNVTVHVGQQMGSAMSVIEDFTVARPPRNGRFVALFRSLVAGSSVRDTGGYALAPSDTYVSERVWMGEAAGTLVQFCGAFDGGGAMSVRGADNCAVPHECDTGIYYLAHMRERKQLSFEQ